MTPSGVFANFFLLGGVMITAAFSLYIALLNMYHAFSYFPHGSFSFIRNFTVTILNKHCQLSEKLGSALIVTGVSRTDILL